MTVNLSLLTTLLATLVAAVSKGTAPPPTITNGTVTVGFNMACGGTISDLHTASVPNFINNTDCTGRQIQTSLYDGNSRYVCCFNPWGWNPVQGGDKYLHGSPVITSAFTTNTAYIRTRPYEWSPDSNGGGPFSPVLTDVELEQWVSFVPNRPNIVRVDYRWRHLGMDTHAEADQEIPAVYVNLGYDIFTTYAGMEPWTGGAVSQSILGDFGDPSTWAPLYTSEQWWALVNTAGVGLTVYVPNQYPYAFGAHGVTAQANYVRPFLPFSLEPLEVRTSTAYLIAGNWADARGDVDALRRLADPDTWPPFGMIDVPAEGQIIAGRQMMVSGWGFDNVQIAAVHVLLDGRDVGAAGLGGPRPDISGTFPGAPDNSGFSHTVNKIRSYPRGSHTLALRLVDVSGNSTVTPGRTVVFQ
jgi:hypothetical protein